MKRILLCSILTNLALVGVAFGQGPKGQVVQRVVIVPPDIALPVIAHQPDCPLQIEDIKLFAFVSGGGGQSYTVRHKGTKPIRSYTIGSWNTAGTGWDIERRVNGDLLPGQVAPREGTEVEIVEVTEGLRKQLNLNGDMRAIVVLMVVRIEYADGSTYDNKPLYAALKKHLDKVSE